MIKRLLVLCLFLTGCGLYWGSDDDQCVPTPVSEGIPAIGYRDPQTGTCEYLGGGGGGGSCCGDDCMYNGTATGIAEPDWGQCNTACDGLDENSCIETVNCHAAYLDQGFDALVPSVTYYGCWQVAEYPSDTNVACAGLDAQSCSEHDGCSMVYTGDTAPQNFEECVAESHGGCGVDIGCPTGSHCEQQCAPCNSMGCQDACAPACVPDAGWGDCTGQILCNMAPPSCPANTTAGIANGCWTGYCIPNAACGSPNPGDCYDTVTCNSAPPSCPSNTLPGIANGCWTGYCIPTASCELAACETLGTETACEARTDCTPIYTGTDCTCTMTGGCTCATETYSKCETGWML